MKYSKTASVAELQGINRLESLRKLLLSERVQGPLRKAIGRLGAARRIGDFLWLSSGEP